MNSNYINTDPLMKFAIPAQKAFADAYSRFDGLLNIDSDYVQITIDKMQEICKELDRTPEIVPWESVWQTYDANLFVEGVLFTAFAKEEVLKNIGWLE